MVSCRPWIELILC